MSFNFWKKAARRIKNVSAGKKEKNVKEESLSLQEAKRILTKTKTSKS